MQGGAARAASSDERTAELIDLCFEQRNALVTTFFDLGRVVAVLDDARALAEKLGDQRRLGWAFQSQIQTHKPPDPDHSSTEVHFILHVIDSILMM